MINKEEVLDKMIKGCKASIAEHEARILEHKKIFDEAIKKEQEILDILNFNLEIYKK